MSLFGGNRDISLFRHLNRELLNNIIEQKVGYYKIILDKTNTNLYGESSGKKYFYDPVLINCLIERADKQATIDEFGYDFTKNLVFKFLRDDLAGIDLSTELGPDGKGFAHGIVPEVGDIVLFNDDYYEIDSIVENQFIVGKNPDYSYSDSTDNFGSSWSIICSGHYTRPEKWGITQERL